MIQNYTTNELENMARSRGLHIKIGRDGTRHSPRYFLLRRDNIELVPPMQIGVSIREAEEWIYDNGVSPSNQLGRSFDPIPKKPMKLL